jgi:hypothetical protein
METDIPFDGNDLSPLLENPNLEWLHPSVIEFGNGNAAVRGERWRYIRYADGEEELYDHHTDPNEWHNLARNPTYQTIKETLSKYLPKEWAPDALRKGAFKFDPENWTFTHKETGRVVHGGN